MHGPQRYISNLSVWHRRNDNSLPTLYNLDFKFLFTTLHKSSKKKLIVNHIFLLVYDISRFVLFYLDVSEIKNSGFAHYMKHLSLF